MRRRSLELSGAAGGFKAKPAWTGDRAASYPDAMEYALSAVAILAMIFLIGRGIPGRQMGLTIAVVLLMILVIVWLETAMTGG